uniref:TD and POZ domain-containing protein 5 n=1 Tax=Lygus hesperus TaxID=30085 RepID=A0A146M975_LYGHE
MDPFHPFSDMLNNLREFMRNGTFTDVVFNVGVYEFTAHKAVLASSSSVFRAMFSDPMIESTSNTVVLTDIDANAFSIFLDYIYSRDNTIVKGDVEQLLMIADKYDVEPLAELCDKSFETQLTVENAIDTLIIADRYNRSELKTKVSLFIKKHRDAVSSCESWGKLESDLVLFDEMLQIFIEGENNFSGDPSFCGISKFVNEITWTLNNNVWECKDEVIPPFTLKLPGNRTSASVNFHVSLININGELGVKIESDYDEALPLTIKVTRRKEGLLRTRFIMYWVWQGNRKVTFYVLRMLGLNYAYPFDLTIALEKTRTSGQHLSPDYTEDAKLTVGDVAIPVHKSVLAGSSEFFSNMFGGERVVEEYPIDGIPERTLNQLVQFMYCHRMTAPKDVDLHLLQGAHRFKLEGLVEHCESILEAGITIGNAMETYAVAEEIGLNRLANSVKKFIVAHAEDIVKQGKVRKLKNSVLLKELFLKLGQ